MNKKLTLERPELHPVPVKSPWHHLGMDCVLANGEPLGALIFKQPEMRKHLMECFELQYLSAFPIMRKRRRANKVKSVSPVPIYCSCRMPEQAGSTLIQCSTCKEWFHIELCVDVPPEAFDSDTKWFCNNCTL